MEKLDTKTIIIMIILVTGLGITSTLFGVATVQYNNLSSDYTDITNNYQAVLDWIEQMIPPSQYLVFADAVRRQYMDIYLDFSNRY